MTAHGLNPIATAFGGAGGQVLSGTGTNGRDGAAEAFAFGTNSATANATGWTALARGESSGVVATDAASGAGLPLSLESHTGGSAGTSAFESRSSVGGAAPGLALAVGLQGAAFGTGLPSLADAGAALAGHANVAAALAPSRALGLVALAGGLAGDASAGSITLDSSVAFHLDLAQLPASGHLVVGLLDTAADGAGFDSLAFQILREGVAVVSETFLDTASALAYFDDHPLDLGALGDGVSGDLDLEFLLGVTSDDPGAAFRASLIIGSVPEPALGALLGAAAAALALRQRQRARAVQREDARDVEVLAPVG